MSRIRSLAVGILLGGPFYLLLIDTVDTPELIAGAIATLLAVIAYEISHSQGFEDAAFRIGWLLEVGRALAQVPRGMIVVSRAIVAQTLRPRPRRGQVIARHYQADDGGSDGPYELGRRAMTEALGSLAPDSFVIGIDPEKGELLLHRLG